MASLSVRFISVAQFDAIALAAREELAGLSFGSCGEFASELEGVADSGNFTQDEINGGYLVGFRCSGTWVHATLDEYGTPQRPCLLG